MKPRIGYSCDLKAQIHLLRCSGRSGKSLEVLHSFSHFLILEKSLLNAGTFPFDVLIQRMCSSAFWPFLFCDPTPRTQFGGAGTGSKGWVGSLKTVKSSKPYDLLLELEPFISVHFVICDSPNAATGPRQDCRPANGCHSFIFHC